MPRTEGAQAIGRATEILRVVARTQHIGATLATISRTTELSRSTAFRILRSLVEQGLLDYETQAHRYYIGPLAYELGLAAHGQARLTAAWRERLDAISRQTGLTAYLVARSDAEVVCLATAQGSAVIRAVPLTVGQRLPLGVGAGSLAILASLEDKEVDALIGMNAARLAKHGGSQLTPGLLWERIHNARKHGFAFSHDTVASGVMGVGVVVSQESELKRLAISVSMPRAELSLPRQAELAGAIRATAHQLETSG